MGNILSHLRRALTENFTIKLMALVLAVALVFFKREDQVTEVTAKVQVELRHPEDRVLMTPRVNMVNVTFRGDYGKLRRLRADEIPPIVMNLAGVEDGQLNFDKRNLQVPPGLTVSEISPAAMVVKFEGQTVADVPVKAILEGEPQRGFRATESTVEPKTVKVMGAKSVVAGLVSVKTKPVSLVGRTQGATLNVGLAPTPAYSRYAVDGQRVKVNFVIAENRGTRVLSKLPVAVLQKEDAEYYFEVSPKSIAITLNGPTRQLSMLDGESVDVFVNTKGLGRKGMYTRRVTVKAPDGVEIAEVTPKMVTLVRRKNQIEEPPSPSTSDGGVE